MEADAPVFIIVGVLAVTVTMIPIIGMLEGFGGSAFGDHDDRSDIRELASIIDEQCGNLNEFDNILTRSTEVGVFQNEKIEFDEDTFSASDEDWTIDIEGSCSVSLEEVDDEGDIVSTNEIPEGSWEAVISGENGELEVIIEP